jgi:uncharacterized protein (UPF0548 family)
MFLIREPSKVDVRHFLSSQSVLPFSYDEVGASLKGALPKGYAVDRYRVKLGEGEEAYERAIEALQEWRQFDLSWVRILPPKAPIEVGMTVGVLARHYGFWSLNPARITYLLEETGAVERFGFGYGTLPGTPSAARSASASSGAVKTTRSTTTSSRSLDRNIL